MSYEKKDGDIALFPNNKTKEKQPDFKGTALIDGKEYDVALWCCVSNGGKKFLSGKASIPEQKKFKDDKVDDLNF